MTISEHYYSGVREDVLALLDSDPGSRILEIGGGDFETLLSLAGTNRELWGVDIRSSDARR